MKGTHRRRTNRTDGLWQDGNTSKTNNTGDNMCQTNPDGRADAMVWEARMIRDNWASRRQLDRVAARQTTRDIDTFDTSTSAIEWFDLFLALYCCPAHCETTSTYWLFVEAWPWLLVSGAQKRVLWLMIIVLFVDKNQVLSCWQWVNWNGLPLSMRVKKSDVSIWNERDATQILLLTTVISNIQSANSVKRLDSSFSFLKICFLFHFTDHESQIMHHET